MFKSFIFRTVIGVVGFGSAIMLSVIYSYLVVSPLLVNQKKEMALQVKNAALNFFKV